MNDLFVQSVVDDPLVPSIRVIPLTICSPDVHWANEDGISPIVQKVFSLGAATEAAALDGHTAIHIIGTHTLPKIEWMRQGHFLEAPPFDVTSFVMFDGVFSAGTYMEAVRAIFAAGHVLKRTPILPFLKGDQPPHEVLDIVKLGSCAINGFRMAPFLSGFPFLNRTNIPSRLFICNLHSSEAHLALPSDGLLVLTTTFESASLQNESCITSDLTPEHRKRFSVGEHDAAAAAAAANLKTAKDEANGLQISLGEADRKVEEYEDKINETLTENDAAKRLSKVDHEEARVARLEANRLQTELEFSQGKAVGLQTALEIANEKVRIAEERLAVLHGESDVYWNPSVLRHFQKEYDARVVGHLDVETMLVSCIQPI